MTMLRVRDHWCRSFLRIIDIGREAPIAGYDGAVVGIDE
jgi:hypothetical protein